MATASFTIYRLEFQDNVFENYCNQVISKYNDGVSVDKRYILKINSTDIELESIENYMLFTRQSPTKPDWQYVLQGLVSDLEELENINHSFVLFLEVSNEVFCITGGTGYLVIGGVKDHYFGLDLLSRIIDPNEDIIKETRDRYFSGNRISGENQYSRFVNINSERGISNYFRELNVFLSKEKIESAFGLEIDGGKDDYKILAKDSINLGKSLNISELDTFLERVRNLLIEEQLFSINPFYVINSQDPLLEQLDSTLEEEFKRIIVDSSINTEIEIVLPILSNASYVLNKKGTIQELPYTESLNDLVSFFNKNYDGNLLLQQSGKLKEEFLKRTILVGKIDGEEISNPPLYNLIDYHVALGDKNYWLMDGNWHSLDRGFMEEINSQFINKVVKKLDEFSGLENIGAWDSGTEGEYNFSHNIIENIYVLDKILINNIELCDLLIIEDGIVYFVHVKNGLDGDARVLSAQIFNAMNTLQSAIIHDKTIFEKYFDSIRKKIGKTSDNTGIETTMSFAARKFCEKFSSSDEFMEFVKNAEKIKFVFAFRPGNQVVNDPATIKSTAAKLAMINIVDDIRQFDFQLEFFEINKIQK